MRLNVDGIGTFLGEFQADDKILVVRQDGTCQLIGFELSTRFTDDMVIEKWKKKHPISAIYYDGSKERYFVKRFSRNHDKVVGFISENERSFRIGFNWRVSVVEIIYKRKRKDRKIEQINLSEFIAIKGISAQGNKLTNNKINEINLLKTKRLSVQEEKEEDTEEVIVEKQKDFLEKWKEEGINRNQKNCYWWE